MLNGGSRQSAVKECGRGMEDIWRKYFRDGCIFPDDRHSRWREGRRSILSEENIPGIKENPEDNEFIVRNGTEPTELTDSRGNPKLTLQNEGLTQFVSRRWQEGGCSWQLVVDL